MFTLLALLRIGGADLAKGRDKRMRLRTKLLLMFSTLSLVVVSLVTALTYWLSSSALVSELEERADQAADRVGAYLELRGKDAARAVEAISREPAVRRTLAGVASGADDPSSPEVVGLAQMSAGGTDLDLLEILDGDGTVLSSAHWKAYYGRPHPGAADLARETSGAPAAAVIEVKGRERMSLVSARTVTIGGSEFHVLGGYYVDADELRELKDLLDVGVMLLPLRGGEAEGYVDAGERKPVSPRTHVFREVYLPHAGEVPVAKFLVGVSRARLQRLADALSRAFLIATAAALLFSWIAAPVMARGTTRRLERLTAGARRIAEGDLSSPVAGGGKDEMGRLIAAFNSMMVDLKESRAIISRMERIAAWREVARRIAHEIKNALSPIQLSIENVQRSHAKGAPDLDVVLSKATDTVREEVDGLRKMVDEFSQLARMPAPNLVRQDVRPVAERVVALHESTNPGVEVTLEAPPEEVEACIDPDQLSRALGNVVANAVEACSEGGRVTVALARSGEEPGRKADRARIDVRDTGKGLDPDQLESIFEPYYTTKKGGTGLGLAIVMKIITDHGGTIKVSGEPGKGSTFTILLPAGLPGGEPIRRAKPGTPR